MVVGEAAHAVDRLLRAAPRRDDQAGHAELLPARDVVAATRPGRPGRSGSRPRSRPSSSSSSRSRAIDRSRRLERVAHADPAVAERARRAAARRRSRRRRGSAATAAARGLGTNTAPSKSKNSPWCVDRRPRSRAACTPRSPRRPGGPGSRSRARPRPTPPRASSRRSRTRSGRPRRCRGSARRAPRRTGGAARGCRRACRAGCARSGPRGTTRYANASKIGVSGGTGGCVSPGCGERLIFVGEHRGAREATPTRSRAARPRACTSTKNVGLSAPSATPNFTVPPTSASGRSQCVPSAVGAGASRRRRGCRRRRGASCR